MPGQARRGVSRRDLLVSLGVAGGAVLGGCVENVNSEGRQQDTDAVVVKGSSTVFPVSDAMAQRYMDDHEVSVTVDATGTGGGFKNHFCPGTSPINGASRRIRETELENCSDNGVEPVEFRVGGDALTVAVNNDAEWVDCITPDELSRIWRDDRAEQWSDVRSEWPDEPISLFGPPPTSGTYDWFNEHVVGEEYEHTAAHEQSEEDNILIKGIEDNPYALGYFGYAYYESNSDRVKGLAVEGDGGSCTDPSLTAASDGSYPLARPLYIYVDRNALRRDPVFDFVAFYLEMAATDLVTEVGYVPLDEETRDENLAKLVRERP